MAAPADNTPARLRIAHVILSQGFAGSERSTAESCAVQSASHDVMLIVRRSHRNAAGASILDHIGSDIAVATVPDHWFTRRGLARALQRFRPDVIHTHLRRATRLVVRIAPDCATVATLHIAVNGPHYLQLGGLICNAFWQQRSIPTTYQGRVFKLNNSLTPHRQLAPDEVAALRRELGAQAGTYLIGGVGRLARSKGWDTLVAAFNSARLPDARLIILGEGRERRRLERLAGPAVLLPGFKHNVKDYYQAFDLFVCPSRREPLPRVILEAMDAGVPVVASRADGCVELVGAYGGDLFAVEDVAALRALLARHHGARTPHRPIDLSAHAVAAVNATIVDAYRDVIARHKTPTVAPVLSALGRA